MKRFFSFLAFLLLFPLVISTSEPVLAQQDVSHSLFEEGGSFLIAADPEVPDVDPPAGDDEGGDGGDGDTEEKKEDGIRGTGTGIEETFRRIGGTLPDKVPTVGIDGETKPLTAVEKILLNFIITPIFILSGGLAVIMVLYSAFRIITARGEEDGLTAAKTTLTWALLGLGLVMVAYTLVSNFAKIIFELF